MRRNQLYKWASELEEKSGDVAAAFNGSGRKSVAAQSKLERLKAELAKATEESDIPKWPQHTLPGKYREVRVYSGTEPFAHRNCALSNVAAEQKQLLRLAERSA